LEHTITAPAADEQVTDSAARVEFEASGHIYCLSDALVLPW